MKYPPAKDGYYELENLVIYGAAIASFRIER